jgi:mannose-6-phosphate isomerase-like protein (cupin superfamily)
MYVGTYGYTIGAEHRSHTKSEDFMQRTITCIIVLAVMAVSTAAFAQKSDNQNPIDGDVNFSRFSRDAMGCGGTPHGGAGRVCHMEMTPGENMQSQFLFVHRGEVMGKSSLGEHVHRWMEEMYFVLDDKTAYFRVNGKSAELPGPCMAICPMGDSHGIYNPWDEPFQLLNVGVTLRDRKYDAVNFNTADDLVGAPLESPPPFMWSVLDSKLCMQHPIENFLGGEGTIYSRVVWDNDDFDTNWMSVKHMVIPPGVSIGHHRHDFIEEAYFIFRGGGRLTQNGVTKDVVQDDCGTTVLHGSHGFWNNTDENCEIVSIAVAMEKGVSKSVVLNDSLVGK